MWILNSFEGEVSIHIINLHMFVENGWCLLSCFNHVQLCVTLWTVDPQVPLPMGFSRQEYWSGLPCPPPRDLPHPGIKSVSLRSPALAGGFFSH